MSKVRLQFPENLGLLGLLGLIGVIGYAIDCVVLQPCLVAFAAFSLIGIRFFRKQHIQFPARLGLLSFGGFLGFLGFIPGAENLKFFYLLFVFCFFFAYLGKTKQPNQ